MNTGHFNQSHYNWFINDDWKLGPNLTLNLGLRWEQPRAPFYEGYTTGRHGTDYYSCAYDFSPANGRIDPVQMMPRGFDIAQWQGPDGIAVPFANLGRRGCYENKWRYFAPRLGLARRMFGTNQTVLRAGVGLTYDQEFGILRARVMRPAIGQLSAISDRGFETPTIFTGQRVNLPTQRQLGEYLTCYFSELDWEEGQVYSYNLSIQNDCFRAPSWNWPMWATRDVTFVRLARSTWPCLTGGYVRPLVGGDSVQATDDPITAGPRAWIPGAVRTLESGADSAPARATHRCFRSRCCGLMEIRTTTRCR